MSSLPGLTLEEYVMWDLDLIVDGESMANPSLALAEAMGVRTGRRRLTLAQFQPILSLYEPFRDAIEYKLEDYSEEDCGSWRDYAGYAFEFIPDLVREQARQLVVQDPR